MNKDMKECFERILNRIDLEFVAEHPETSLELIKYLRDKDTRSKEYIKVIEKKNDEYFEEVQRLRKLNMLKSAIEESDVL